MQQLTRWQRMLPANPKLAYFPTKKLPEIDKWQLLREIGKKQLSYSAQLKLEWIIFTAIEELTKIAFARIYSTNTSLNAEDFLKKLMYLVEGKINLMHQDNGSEFQHLFKVSPMWSASTPG